MENENRAKAVEMLRELEDNLRNSDVIRDALAIKVGVSTLIVAICERLREAREALND